MQQPGIRALALTHPVLGYCLVLGGSLGPGAVCPLQPPGSSHSQDLGGSTPTTLEPFSQACNHSRPAPFPENLCHKEGEALIWPVSPPLEPSSPKGTLIINMRVTPCILY